MNAQRSGTQTGSRTSHIVLLARSAVSRYHQREAGRLALALLLPAAAALVCLLLTGAVAAAFNIYHRATATVASPGAVIAGMADYGGAQIYDRNQKLLYRFPDPAGGIHVPLQLSNVNQTMVNATVSTEDAGYWTGAGIDPLGTLRAASANVLERRDPFGGRGGSGITQQLVKQTLIPEDQRNSRSLSRKLTEAILALELTRSYSKSQILEWYLNMVNYGGVHDGIESAAQGYFGVHAADLDLAQAAMLAGIPQSPAKYSPYADPQRARLRQAEVLDLMVKHHDINQSQAAAAKQEHLAYQAPQQALPLRAPWFVEYVRQQLISRFGDRCFETCGLQVQTTLDLDLEDHAAQILNDNLAKWGDPVGAKDGALLSIDARSGEILVMLGSRNYDDGSARIQGKNNFATAVMQPGSSFKPFVYLSLFLRRGYGPDSIIWDAPYSSRDGYRCQDPVQGGRTQGPIPVRLALGSSLNCAANRAAEVTGIQNIVDTAHAMGFTTMESAAAYGASIATGGANITLVDMVYGYTTLARNGSMIGADPPKRWPNGYRSLDPVALIDVRSGEGKSLYHYQAKTAQVVPEGYPYLVTSIISDCANRRLIWQCGFPEFVLSDGRPVAAKTGTQQGSDLGHTIANWQFMYTPQLVTGGWVGNADRSPWTDVNGGANAVGYSVEQLEDLIAQTYQIPAQDFERPVGVLNVPVHVPDGSRGLLAGCGPVEFGLFVNGNLPDINNRVCYNGRVVIPDDQAGTGGLGGNSPVAAGAASSPLLPPPGPAAPHAPAP
ncbi:MAG TPA: transglycosylase domain-containing protein, partial [Dehalococcoidia bacterium]|nr:transglycosylase domain-containing protein [Dehalococcoidia bacterium]